MNILLIGGSGFIGRHIVSQLQEKGHRVSVLHRGNAALPAGAEQILGDRNRLGDFRDSFQKKKFDVVIDMILSSQDQAREVMGLFRGITERMVGLSSMDVYRAWGVFYGNETGGLQEMPVTEDSDLRSMRASPYPPERLKQMKEIFSWVNDEYEKIFVEKAVLNDHELPGTVLRLPMVYGPGDPVHRLHSLLQRMEDGRRSILFAEDVAALRLPRGYVENVAHAIALAAVSVRAAGRVYNVAEATAFSELDWAKKVAAVAGWDGNFIVLPHDKAPKHLLMPGNTAQHLLASSDRIRSELGYREPVSLEESLRRTIDWERQNRPLKPLAEVDYAAEDQAISEISAAS